MLSNVSFLFLSVCLMCILFDFQLFKFSSIFLFPLEEGREKCQYLSVTIFQTHRHTHTPKHTYHLHTLLLKCTFEKIFSIERYSICLIINGTYKN